MNIAVWDDRDGRYQYKRAVAGLVLLKYSSFRLYFWPALRVMAALSFQMLVAWLFQSLITCTPLTHKRAPSLVRVENR